MEEFNDLVNKICNSSSSLDTRSVAEQRLLEILSNRAQWKQYVSLLFQANDTVCFFICIGFQKMIWKHWRDISMEDKMLLSQTITQVLTSRQNSQHFAKSKMEQVLATICANSCSLEPALSLMTEADKPGAAVGISAMRTVLDLVLSDDPKLLPDYKAPLLSATNEILFPLTNVACSACSLALQSCNQEAVNIMLVSLELLKIIISRLQIGPHISMDVINLFFTIAEFGADNNSIFHKAAMSSIEALTEIMSKKYLPPGPSAASANGTANTAPGGTGIDMLMDIVAKCVILLEKFRSIQHIDDSETVLYLLEFISVFAESHMEHCITHGSNGNNAGVTSAPAQVVFSPSITAFFEELIAISTSAMDPTVLHKVVSVWNRVVSLGTVRDTLVQQPSLCLPIVSHLLQASLIQTNSHLSDSTTELVEDMKLILFVDPHMKSVLSHISDRKDGSSSSKNSSCQARIGGSPHGSNNSSSSNSNSNSSGNGIGNNTSSGMSNNNAAAGSSFVHRHHDSDVLGAEEYGYEGTAMQADVQHFLGELVACPEVQTWLNQSVSQLVGQNVAELLSLSPKLSVAGIAAVREEGVQRAVDLNFLVKVLPLVVGANKAQLVPQLLNLVVELIEAQLHLHGKVYEVLLVGCCQMAGQIIQSSSVVPSPSTLTAEGVSTMEAVFSLLVRSVSLVCDHQYLSNASASAPAGNTAAAGNSSAAYCPYTVKVAQSILFTQSVIAYSELWGLDSLVSIKSGVEQMLMKLLDHQTSAGLPLEVYILLLCAQDHTEPHSIAKMLVDRCVEIVSGIETTACQNNRPPELQHIEQLVRVIGAIDALARCHSISKPQRRRILVSYLSELQPSMGRIASTVFRCWISTYTNAGSVGATGGVLAAFRHSVGYCARLVISMTSGLLQCLGKKTFGKSAIDVLSVCVEFVENISQIAVSLPDSNNSSSSSNTSPLSKILFENSGLLLLKQMLELSRVLAESSSSNSSTANEQAMTTHRLLSFMIGGLNDDRVCAELLHPTLTAGITAISCYWQKTHKALPFLSSINHQGPQASLLSGIRGALGSPQQQDQASMPDINGENVRPIVLLLTQLCVGSLNPNVPPHDTLTAMEGLLQLSDTHKLFEMPWFQNQCWGLLLTPCLKAALLRIHNSQRSTLESLLVALATAGEAAYTDVTRMPGYSGNSSGNRSRSLSNTGAPSPGPGPGPGGDGLQQGDLQHELHAVAQRRYAKHQEFWISIGREIVGIAAEHGCSEVANHTLYSVLNLYQTAAVAAGLVGDAAAPSPTRHGPVVIDMRTFLDKVVNPISSEIARLS